MRKNEKILIFVLLAILVIVLIVVNVNKKGKDNSGNNTTEKYVEVLEDGTKLNTSNKLSKTKKINGLEITNIQLTTKDGMTVLLADVKNTTSSYKDMTSVTVKILDKSGKELTSLKGLIAPLEAGETTQLNIGVTSDYANAYDFEIVEN